MEYFIRSTNPNVVWVKEKSIDSKWIVAEFYKPLFLEILNKTKENIINSFKFSEVANINRVTGFEVEKFLELVDKGIPYLRVTNVTECFIDFNNMNYIPQHVHKKFSKSQFKKGDIALTITGRVGTAAIITDDSDYNACQDVVKVSLKNDNIDPYYLTVYLNSKYNYHLLNRFHSGGSRPRTLINNVREVVIPIPSPEIQKYIGDKVRKAEELREEAKKIKVEAERDLEDALKLMQLQEILSANKNKFSWVSTEKLQSRIDGEFYKTDFIINNEHMENLKRMNIQVLKLNEIIKKGSYGILPSSNDYGKGKLELLRSTNLKEFLIDDSNVIKVPESYYKEKVRVEEGDILLEIKGQCYTGAIIQKLENKKIVNGSIYKFSVKKGFNNYYILAYLLSDSGQLQKQQNLANSIISYLSINCIKNLNIPILPKEKQQIIGDKYNAYVDNIQETKYLIQQAKQDVEDLIEGNFDMSKLNDTSTESKVI